MSRKSWNWPVPNAPDGIFVSAVWAFFLVVYTVVGVTVLVIPTGTTPNLASSKWMMNFTKDYVKWSGGACTQGLCTSPLIVSGGNFVNGMDLLVGTVFLMIAYYAIVFVASLRLWPEKVVVVSNKAPSKKDINNDVGNWFLASIPSFRYTELNNSFFRSHWPTEMVFATVDCMLLTIVFYFVGMRDTTQILLMSAGVLYHYASSYKLKEPRIASASTVSADQKPLSKVARIINSSVFSPFHVLPFFLFWSALFMTFAQIQGPGATNAPLAIQIGIFFIFISQILRSSAFLSVVDMNPSDSKDVYVWMWTHGVFAATTLTVVGVTARDWTAAGTTIYV